MPFPLSKATVLKITLLLVPLAFYLHILFSDHVDVHAKAPSFALIAAAGMCIRLVPDKTEAGEFLDFAIMTLVVVGSFLAALVWLTTTPGAELLITYPLLAIAIGAVGVAIVASFKEAISRRRTRGSQH